MSKQNQYPKYLVDGVDIDAITIIQATDYIARLAANHTHPSCYVVKPYVEFFAEREDPRVRGLLNQAELCLPDGIALNWATWFLYGTGRHWWDVVCTGLSLILNPKPAFKFLPDRFAGTNATWPLLERCEHDGLRVFLIGSPKTGSIIETANVIRRRLPRINITGTSLGEVDGLQGQALLEALRGGLEPTSLAAQIEAAGADVILVGMGFPLQETLMAKLQGLLAHGVMIGEGGSFDYQSFGGHRAKAPGWIQRAGLEWLWRLILEPKRLVRQLAIPQFIWRIYRSRPVSRHQS